MEINNINAKYGVVEFIKYSSGKDSAEHFMKNLDRNRKSNLTAYYYNSASTIENLIKYMSYPMTKKDLNAWGKHIGLDISPAYLWNKYLTKINKLLVKALAQKKQTIKAANGYKVNISRYLSGHPKNMIKRKHQEAHNDIIDIFVLNSTYKSYSPQFRIHIQAIVSAIISGLEMYGGYKIRLSAGRIAKQSKYDTSVLSVHHYPLKQPMEQLTLNKHGFIMMAPAIQQVFGWGVEEGDDRMYVERQHRTINSGKAIYGLKKDYNSVEGGPLLKESKVLGENVIIFNLNEMVNDDLDTENLFVDKKEEKLILNLINQFVDLIEEGK